MTVREDLEYIWEEYPCLCPSHLVRWNFTKIGRWWITGCIAGLWYTKGELTFPKYKRYRKLYGHWPKGRE